jgi:anti-anti-sigma factor
MEADRTAPVCGVDLRVSARGLTLEIRGVLDSDSLPALSAQLARLQCSPCEEVVVDVRRVDVLDHAGCNAIASLAHYVPARGGRFVIRCKPGAIKGLLVSTGLGEHIEELAPRGLVGSAN